MAQAQQQHGGELGDRGADPGAGAAEARRVGRAVGALVERELQQMFGQRGDQRMGAVHGRAARRGWRGEVDVHALIEPLRGQTLAQRRRQRRQRYAQNLLAGAAACFRAGAEAREAALDEAAHGSGIAQSVARALPFREHLFGPEAALGEHRAVGAGLFGQVGPDDVEIARRRQLAEVECLLLAQAAILAAQQHRGHQRLGQAVVVVRQRHGHAELAADGLGLAQDDVEHRAIHRIVLAIEQHRAHQPRRLAEAVDAPFALFVTRGIPGEVVVHDRVVVLLEVYAFGQAVGGDE